MAAKKKTATQEVQKELSAQKHVLSGSSAGGPSQDDLNPAFAPLRDENVEQKQQEEVQAQKEQTAPAGS